MTASKTQIDRLGERLRESTRSLLESPGLDLFDVGRGQLSVELHRRERALRAGLRGLIAGLAVRYSSE